MAGQEGETVIRCMVCDGYEGPIFEFEDEYGTLRICVSCRHGTENGDVED